MHTLEITPAPCLVCGRGNTPNGDDGTRPTFVDLERDVNWNDPAIICEDCVVTAAALVGMMSPDDVADLRHQLRNKDQKIHTLNAEIDSLHRKEHRRQARARKAVA